MEEPLEMNGRWTGRVTALECQAILLSEAMAKAVEALNELTEALHWLDTLQKLEQTEGQIEGNSTGGPDFHSGGPTAGPTEGR